MDIFFNIMIIIFAIIGFLIYYYYTQENYKEKVNEEKKLPLNINKTDMEAGEDIGIDEKKTGVDQAEMHEEYRLKERYNQDFIRLMVRDPASLFAYWEIKQEPFYQNSPYLRLSNETENSFDDIEINHYTSNWYLHSRANTRYNLAIGYKKDGVFYSLAVSDSIKTPLERPSNVIDEHWMTIDELSKYSYRIEMDTLAMIKKIEERRISEELKADSLYLTEKKD